jgi:hypothetical protein
MEVIHEQDGSITLRIQKPKDMTVERFMVLAARLEKILNQFGGTIRVVE